VLSSYLSIKTGEDHYQLAPGVGEKLRELDEGSESNEPFAAIHQPPAPDVLAADPMKEVSQEFEF
jgi:hypothetical protein